jgi:hypothetical protein
LNQLSDRAPIVDADGRPNRVFLRFLQDLGAGVVERTGYTAAELANIAPAKYATAFCTDSSVTTFGNAVAGGGANIVPVYWDLTDWRVG